MSVTLGQDAIILFGDCGVEQAEALLALIMANPDFPVDLTGAQWVHTALWQVMLTLTPRTTGVTKHTFINQWVLPLVSRPGPDTNGT
jgi:phage tail sheath gpL-like